MTNLLRWVASPIALTITSEQAERLGFSAMATSNVASAHFGFQRRIRTTSPNLLVAHCLFAKVMKSFVISSRFRVHGQFIESKSGVAHGVLSDGVRQGGEGIWCGLCGDGEGWLTCGRCMGEGGFPTRPGLAGVKGKVGWGKCKTCFGKTVVPCLLCGVSDVAEWKLWVEHVRRHPREIDKRTIAP